MGEVIIRAAWRTVYEDPGWEAELKARVRAGVLERGYSILRDFRVQPMEDDEPSRAEVVKFYVAKIRVVEEVSAWIDLSRATVARPAVAGPQAPWIGLLDEEKTEIRAAWYSRLRRKGDSVDFDIPQDAEPCAVCYTGEYPAHHGGAALRVYAVDAGDEPIVLQPGSIFSV